MFVLVVAFIVLVCVKRNKLQSEAPSPSPESAAVDAEKSTAASMPAVASAAPVLPTPATPVTPMTVPPPPLQPQAATAESQDARDARAAFLEMQIAKLAKDNEQLKQTTRQLEQEVAYLSALDGGVNDVSLV